MNNIELAQVAYAAFRNMRNQQLKERQQMELPEWSGLHPEKQQSWVCAALAVQNATIAALTAGINP